MITGDVRDYIKLSYTGGSTDMFIPSNIAPENITTNNIVAPRDDNKLYCYDINSLYPYVMQEYPMPTGKLFYFEGDITKTEYVNKLGFYYCKVTAPKNLEHPIIQLHVNNSTMSPLGEFKTVLYSEEIKNAIKFGYKFDIINGYFFGKSDYIFKEYITQLYNLRQEYSKDHPMNFIAKILMNSLYGRFGMSDQFDTLDIYDNKSFEEYMNKVSFTEAKSITASELGNEHMIVSKEKDRAGISLASLNIRSNVNVAIASATSSMGRITMSQFKNNKLIKIFYSDTDSVIIQVSPELLEKYFPGIRGNKIGQLKLEYVINRAVFLGPKSYFLELENGQNIIKVKGLKSDVLKNSGLTISHFYLLLYKDTALSMNLTKWFRNKNEDTTAQAKNT